MSLGSIDTIIKLDESYDFHLARLLILMNEMSKKEYGEIIQGITKLVKLDFLLRYPNVLEQALKRKGKSTASIKIKPYEVDSVESKMIRYKFGPWDNRYWEFLRILEAKGLIDFGEENKTVLIRITPQGKTIAENLIDLKEFEDYFKRSKVITTTFGKNKATYLMKLMYDLRPELYQMKYGAVLNA